MSTPLYLLTGFLGSGKTTLLNHLLGQADMANTLVIINEFGEIGLDHLLVAHSNEDAVVEMSSGCLCCTIRGDLVKTLSDAGWRFSRGGQRQFDRVIIETTGLADPVPIIHTLMTDAKLAEQYRLQGVLTVVDQCNGQSTLDNHDEAIKQVAMASKLLLSKADQSRAEDQSLIQQRLRRINPTADQTPLTHGQIEVTQLFDANRYDPREPALDSLSWIGQSAGKSLFRPLAAEPGGLLSPNHQHDHDQDHHHDVNRHSDDITAYCYRFSEPFSLPMIFAWLESLLGLTGPNMLRVKGVINVDGQRGPVVIHGVQHIFHPPVYLDEWPDDDHDSRLVFITRKIPEHLIQATLEHLQPRDVA